MPFLDAKDIQKMIGRSEEYCRKVIRELNAELNKKGYITFRGRVPQEYFEERCCYRESAKTSGKGRAS